jgi:hypothetical protein
MRATFITLALEDGADPHVIETRVTHTKKSRSAFDGYNRGRQWEIRCAEVAKLKIARVRDPHDNVIVLPIAVAGGGATGGNPERCTIELGAVLVQSGKTAEMSASSKSGRRDSNPRRQPWQGDFGTVILNHSGRAGIEITTSSWAWSASSLELSPPCPSDGGWHRRNGEPGCARRRR